MTPVELTFWLALGLVGYAYAGYPAIIWVLARLCPRPVRSGPVTPTMTIVITAHNEERHIATKIENCLALSYPTDRLNIIVVSDGSTDRTPAIVTDYVSRFPERVMLISLPLRRGKATALNVGIAQASGEIVLLADARQQFDSEAAGALAHNFADPEIGAVSGELILRSNGAPRQGASLGLYWRYEKAIRYVEGRWHSTIGFTGAVSAIRRSLFEPLPKETLVDDLVTPLRIVAKRYRVIFESRARAYDSVSSMPGREFTRKVRTLAGVLQTCLHTTTHVGPLTLTLWWQLISHKLLRLVVPYLLVLAFVANALLAERLYRITFLTQIILYGLGIAGLILPRSLGQIRLLALPATFLWLNLAAVVAAFRYLGGQRHDLWHPASPHEPQYVIPSEAAYPEVRCATRRDRTQ